MKTDAGDPRPIGVFDSGVGGLTVLRALRAKLPAESIVYLGDTARLPYGTKSPQTVARYAVQAARVLEDRDVKMLVVACNTASALALDALHEEFDPIPVVGVVRPGAEAACRASRVGRIAVVSTESTAANGAYVREIHAIRPDIDVVSQACSVLVAVAEEGWVGGRIARLLVGEYLDPIFGAPGAPDCLLLGCTHFPVLKNAFREVIGESVRLVDSAEATADVVAARLLDDGSAAPKGSVSGLSVLATDAPGRFARVAAHFLPGELSAETIELVDL